jgi:heme/copper-type cytochrome/quinol oxidase subunit 2|tara:strand:+ start:612 stop:1088 length:477 start_codon:yes stop_codon:yes gene_type:complete
VVKIKNYLLIFGMISIFLISACAQQQPTQEIIQQPSVIEPAREVVQPSEDLSQEPARIETPAETITSGVVEIDMIARQWDFEPATIRVKEGDRVKLNIRNVDVTHGFVIFEFGINERLSPGKTTTVEFIADKKGEYIFFCSVPCGIGHTGMKGKLVVE